MDFNAGSLKRWFVIMVFTKRDFNVLNISNIPVSEAKMWDVISFFGSSLLSLEEINNENLYLKLGYSKESFRKTINHCEKLGVLIVENNKYRLSPISFSLYDQEITFNDYLKELIQANDEIYSLIRVVIVLLDFFSSSLRLKTLYVLFALISKSRTDQSAQASVGRNLRAYFSLLNMLTLVNKNKERLYLKKENDLIDEFGCNIINPISKQFKQEIINVNLISKYLSNFFDTIIVEQILSCVSTYEMDNYVWTKSSLFKNQGEIRNLYDEYIMTVIIKRKVD